ncbi:MAG: DUF4145 domain-containing protein [Planctomycetes bacterium]|nr:DUF4145 domain-containing protein [Planctomycetota bacterium]
MSDQSDPRKGNYQFDLDVQVETCIDNYEQDMKHWYASGGPTDPEISTAIFEQAKRFADHVLKAAKELVHAQPGECALVEPELKQFKHQIECHVEALASTLKKKGLSPDGFLTAFREMACDTRPDDDSKLKVVWDLLLTKSMRDAVERSRKSATRLLLLFALDFPPNPTERTRDFLRQVTECFALGLDVPCIVFCRSAIDVALEDAGFKKRGLKGRIKEATTSHLLDADAKGYAMKVKELGDDAVHGKPLSIADELETIRKTFLVLEQITRPRPA